LPLGSSGKHQPWSGHQGKEKVKVKVEVEVKKNEGHL